MTETRKCPDCAAPLKSPLKCRCGWKAPVVGEGFTRQGIPCAGHQDCKFPGRVWVSTLARNERLCVFHYYRALEADHSLIEDGTVPPREQPVDMKSRAAGA
jgi:hypothetical protein